MTVVVSQLPIRYGRGGRTCSEEEANANHDAIAGALRQDLPACRRHGKGILDSLQSCVRCSLSKCCATAGTLQEESKDDKVVRPKARQKAYKKWKRRGMYEVKRMSQWEPSINYTLWDVVSPDRITHLSPTRWRQQNTRLHHMDDCWGAEPLTSTLECLDAHMAHKQITAK